MSSRPKNFFRREDGAAILEFALVLPLLVALLFGCYELGRALLVRQALEEAVRAGGRYLARVPDPTCAPACSLGALHAVRMATERIVESTGLPRSVVLVAPERAPPAGTVVLSATVTFPVDLLLLPGIGPRWTLGAQHQEAWIGE